MNGCAVGISAAIERARWRAWEQEVALAPRSYARAVQEAGGLALLLPPDAAAEAAPERWLDRIDALLLSGGSDIDPAFYGQQPHPQTKGIWPERDRFEIALTRGALERRMPVLGICRGMQLLNVALGGDLVQHLPDLVGNDEHRDTPGAFGDHEVRLEPGSLAARAVGAERTTVKSHHHQGVNALGQGLRATGWSQNGDVVEAIEIDEREQPFALGVLWHPEEEERSRVVGALVEAAKVKA
ncbi:MAG TPA: gamma-glutamyl-gamma-aminobutyrate hydrolase family protein [Solirubrobacterales bacterium]|jgi:putative glutamine amidotransferase